MSIYIEKYEKPKSCDMCVFSRGTWLVDESIKRCCNLLPDEYPFTATMEPPPENCPILNVSKEIEEQIAYERDLNAFKPNAYLNEQEYKKWRKVLEEDS